VHQNWDWSVSEVDGRGCIETDDPAMEPPNLCQGYALVAYIVPLSEYATGSTV
jgi:hypothetical protein